MLPTPMPIPVPLKVTMVASASHTIMVTPASGLLRYRRTLLPSLLRQLTYLDFATGNLIMSGIFRLYLGIALSTNLPC